MRISKLISGALILAGAGAGAGATQAQNLPVFKIGIVTAATGAASTIAAPANQAIALYRERIAAQRDLPFKVEFIQYDDASDPTKSVNLVRKLIQEDGAAMVICCTTTPSSLAVAKVSEDGQTPTVSMASGAAVVEPASERRYTFKTPIPERLMLNRTMDHMLKHGVKTLAFLGLEDAYGEGGWMETKALAEKRGIKIVSSERFARSDTNFTPQALKTLQAKPDAVYIHAIPPSASLVHEALRRVGYSAPIYHGAGAATAAFTTIGKSAVEGAFVGAPPITVYKDLGAENPLRTSVGDFAKAYDGKYGAGKAEIFSAQGYDAIGLAVDAVKRYAASGKKVDLAQARNDLRDELEKTREYAGALGIFSYSPDDHNGLDKRTPFLVQVEGGQFRMVKD